MSDRSTHAALIDPSDLEWAPVLSSSTSSARRLPRERPSDAVPATRRAVVEACRGRITREDVLDVIARRPPPEGL